MRTTRRSPIIHSKRGRVAAVAAVLLLPAVAGGFGGSITAAQAGPIVTSSTPSEPGAVVIASTPPTPTTGTDATDAAVAAGLLLAVGGLTAFTARSVRRRPHRSRWRL